MITISFNQDLTCVRGYYCCLSQYYSSTYPWPAKWVWRALHLHMNLHCTRYGIAWSSLGLPAMQSWRQCLGKAKPGLVEAERRTKPNHFIVSPNHLLKSSLSRDSLSHCCFLLQVVLLLSCRRQDRGLSRPWVWHITIVHVFISFIQKFLWSKDEDLALIP